MSLPSTHLFRHRAGLWVGLWTALLAGVLATGGSAWAQQAPVRAMDLSPHPKTTAGTQAATPAEVAAALDRPADSISVAFTGDPAAYAALSEAASDFPVAGASYLVLSSGFAGDALTANTTGSLSGLHGSTSRGTVPGPGGGTDLLQLAVDLVVPEGASTVSFDFKFFSEEFPEFIGSAFNDVFLAEVDASTFFLDSTLAVVAPNNVVFDESGTLVSVNTTGDLSFTGNDPDVASPREGPPLTGTTYDGGTAVLTTTVPLDRFTVTDGRVRIVFSVFDVGDDGYDSAVFLDRLRFDAGDGGGTGVADITPPTCSGNYDGSFFGSVIDSPNTIPSNRGVDRVQLAPGSRNVALSVDAFEPGTSAVSFQVDWTDATQTQAGVGTVVGTDVAGNTCSIDVTFAVPPTAAPDTPGDVGPSQATLRGTVDPNGAETTVVFDLFDADTGQRLQSISLDSTLSATTPATTVEVLAEDLAPGTSYRYRITATNESGATLSDFVDFATTGGIPTASPEALAFNVQQVGGTPTARTLAVENTGGAPLTVTAVGFAPASDVFALTADSGETLLQPGEMRGLTVTFTPLRDAEESATLVVETDGGTVSVPVTGTGLSLNLETDESVEAGTEVAFSVDLSDSFTPQTRVLCHRPGGAPASAYACETMTVESVEQVAAKRVFRGAIPPEAVTERGVEYFLRFVETDAAGNTSSLSFPGVDPETNPSQIRVRFGDLDAAGPFQPETYRMISVPAALTDATVGAVLGDDLGPYDDRVWRLLQWNAAAERYDELSRFDRPLEPGRSYWLISRAGTGFTAGAGTSTDLQAPFTLTLAPGWHQISTPFAFPVAWSTVGGAAQVEGPFGFDGEGFIPNQLVLQPWAGYFVLNPGPEPVTLTIPPREAPTQAVLAQKRPAHKSAAPEAAYRIALEAALTDGRRDAYNVVGTRPGAADGSDRYDVSEPPPVGPSVRLSIDEGAHPLAQSFRPTGGDGQVWDLTLSTSEQRARAVSATIRLHPEDIPDGRRIFLLDVDAGEVLPLAGNRTQVVLGEGSAPRRLRLIVGTSGFAKSVSNGIPLTPAATALLPGYPNPLRSSVTIPFTLAEDARVDVTVYDLLGRRIRQISLGDRPAGAHELTWDGHTDLGRPAASGVYFLRMVAGEVRATQKLVIVR